MLPLLIGSFLQLIILYADAFTLTSSSFRPCDTTHKVITVQTIARRCSTSISYSTSLLLAAAADCSESNDDDGSTSSSTKDGETSATNSAKITHHVQQKKPSSSTSSLLPLGYTFAAVMNIAAVMSLIWGSCAVAKPSSTTTAMQSSVIPLLSSNYHYWDPTFTSGVLTYLLLGTGTCHVLSNLTKQQQQQQITTHHQQLQQKQRQRLTMGTILFSMIGMFSIPGEAGYHYHHNQIKFTTSLVLCQLAKLVTAAISFIGWEDTIPNIDGFGSSSSTRRKNILHEIISGIKTSWKTLRITNTHPASFYRTCFIFVTLGNAIFNIPNLIFYLKEGVNWFSMPISLIISSIGRMSLLSVILFVLKEEHASRQMIIIEGGDDGEKGIEKKKKAGMEEASSMFVMLNMMVGIWAVGVGISQGFVEGEPFNLRRAADKFLFGLIFLNNGVLMKLTKMGWIKSRDEIDPDADPPLRIML
jgi:hypothetical protein